MIWTHDADFLDDRLVPEHRNPGVVVLPGGDGDQRAMIVGLAVAILVLIVPQTLHYTWQKLPCH